MHTIEKMTKNQQYNLFQELKDHLPSTNDIARNCNVSSSLVGYIKNGLNHNEKVLKYIFDNLKEGWEDAVSSDVVSMIKNF